MTSLMVPAPHNTSGAERRKTLVHTRPHLRWPRVRFGGILNSLLFFKTEVCPMAEVQMPRMCRQPIRMPWTI